jgi:hypothetical protein
MAKTTEVQRPQITALRVRSDLWKRVRSLAVERNVKLWEAVESGLEMWVKNGKAGA